MRSWVWVRFGGEDAVIIKAPDEDTAYRVAIACRIRLGSEDAQDASRWFHENDEIYEIIEEITDKPYEGKIEEEL